MEKMRAFRDMVMTLEMEFVRFHLLGNATAGRRARKQARLLADYLVEWRADLNDLREVRRAARGKGLLVLPDPMGIRGRGTEDPEVLNA